ncbi:hypothetical protein IMG5_151770, partial [Ichthyophthirius multifiliis]
MDEELKKIARKNKYKQFNQALINDNPYFRKSYQAQNTNNTKLLGINSLASSTHSHNSSEQGIRMS